MKLLFFWHKYSILNFYIGLTKLVGALSVWEDISRSFSYSSIINVKTGARRITWLNELSSLLRPRRRATKDYSSSRILHLAPVAKVETKKKKRTAMLFVCVCFFIAVPTYLVIYLSIMSLLTRVQTTLLASICQAIATQLIRKFQRGFITMISTHNT